MPAQDSGRGPQAGRQGYESTWACPPQGGSGCWGRGLQAAGATARGPGGEPNELLSGPSQQQSFSTMNKVRYTWSVQVSLAAGGGSVLGAPPVPRTRTMAPHPRRDPRTAPLTPGGPEDRTTHPRGTRDRPPPPGDSETTPLTPGGPRDHNTIPSKGQGPHHLPRGTLKTTPPPQGDPETTPHSPQVRAKDHTISPQVRARGPHHTPGGPRETTPLTLGETQGPPHSPQRDPESTPRTQGPRSMPPTPQEGPRSPHHSS